MTDDQSRIDSLFEEIRNAEDLPTTKDQIIYFLMWAFVGLAGLATIYVSILLIILLTRAAF